MDTPHRLTRVLPWAALTACAALLVFLAVRHQQLTRAYNELRRSVAFLQTGDLVPTFHAVTLSGATVTVGATEAPGSRQVIFMLRSTCPYCMATLPAWKHLADSLSRVPGSPIEVIGISVDSTGRSPAYAQVHGLGFPIVLFPERKLARLYRAAVVPQTLVLNGEGRVLYARVGVLDDPVAIDSVYRAATAHETTGMPLVRANQAQGAPAR
jgi:cytochrome c biogenesis protein CcmG/thiol:disulfide interchange protein DsbE